MWLLKIWLKIKQSYVNFFDCLYLCLWGSLFAGKFQCALYLGKDVWSLCDRCYWLWDRFSMWKMLQDAIEFHVWSPKGVKIFENKSNMYTEDPPLCSRRLPDSIRKSAVHNQLVICHSTCSSYSAQSYTFCSAMSSWSIAENNSGITALNTLINFEAMHNIVVLGIYSRMKTCHIFSYFWMVVRLLKCIHGTSSRFYVSECSALRYAVLSMPEAWWIVFALWMGWSGCQRFHCSVMLEETRTRWCLCTIDSWLISKGWQLVLYICVFVRWHMACVCAHARISSSV